MNPFSNCAGNPDCTCDQTASNIMGVSFSNCSGCGVAYSNLSGSQFNNLVGLETPTALQTLTAPTATGATAQPSTLDKLLGTASSVLGIFGKSQPATAPVTVTVQEEKKIPTMVWVGLGILVALLVIFLVIKLRK
jgi:hypothetical protein